MIHLLYGPNTYALNVETARLREAYIARYGDHGYERVASESLTPNTLYELLQGVSLFTPHRMVVIKNLSQQKAVWEKLEQWVDTVPTELDLVLVEEHPDKRTKTFKTLTKKAATFSADVINEAAAISWLMTEAMRRSNKELTRSVAQLLVNRTGVDQATLSKELDKLLLHEVINEALVTSLTELAPQATAFELLDAITAKQPKKAHAIISQLRYSEDPYRLFGLFSSQVFTLAAVIAAGKAVPAAQIAKDTGAHPFVISKLSKSAATTTWSEIKEVIEAVAALDDKLKTSGIEPWELLSATLTKIAAR